MCMYLCKSVYFCTLSMPYIVHIHADYMHIHAHSTPQTQHKMYKNIGIYYPLSEELVSSEIANIRISDVLLVPLNYTEQGRSLIGTKMLR